MGRPHFRILMIMERQEHAERVKALLAEEPAKRWSIRTVKRLSTAERTLANQRYEAVVLDLGIGGGLDEEGQERLIAHCRPASIIALSEYRGAGFAAQLAHRGFQDWVCGLPFDDHGMLRALVFAAGRNPAPAGQLAQQNEIIRALEQSQERYRAILNGIEEGYFEVDLKGSITFCNQTLCKIFGFSRDELLGMNYRGYTSEQTAREVFAAYNHIFLSGEANPSLVYEIIDKNGNRRNMESSVSLIVDPDGCPTGFRGLARDVSERKRSEEVLRQSEERYRTILESIEDAYFEVDKAGNLIFWNKAMGRLLGYSQKELGGLNNRQVTDRANAKILYNAFNKIYRTGKPNRGIEYQMITKKGDTRYVESSASSILTPDGGCSGFRGIIRDVTERKLAEVELQRAKNAAERATQAKSEFLANMSHEIRTPMNGIIGMYNLLLSTRLTPEQMDYVETGKRSADSLLTIINDILDFSKIEAGKLDFESVDFDLRKFMEEVVELPAMLSHQKGLEFAYHIHPEIPSLLTGDPGRLRQILLNLAGNAIKFTRSGEVVMRVDLEEQTATGVKLRFAVKDTGIGIPASDQPLLFKSFHQVDASTTRKYGGTGLGLAICKRLVEMMDGAIGVQSAIGAGSTFWFSACFRKQTAAREKDLRLPQTIRSKRILLVDDNKTNLDILKSYLCAWGCLCDITRSGEAALAMMQAVNKVGAPYDLVITDMRMPEMSGEELGRQIKSNRELKGTRMILLTSQGMRGDAAKMRAIGFAAYLTKPIRRSQLFDCLVMILSGHRRPDKKAKPQLITRHSIDEARRRRLRILLAEDNNVNRKLALHMLEKFGFQADAVATGLEALQALELAPYDLVLMDVQMPEMDGLEATRAIRDPRSAVRDHTIPIIAMTAHAMKGDRELCLAAGMNDYLAKPIQPDLLFTAIQGQVEERIRNRPGNSDPFEKPAS